MAQPTITNKRGIESPTWLLLLRILLGLIIMWKGLNFILDVAVLQSMIEQTNIGAFSRSSEALAFLLSFISLLLGFFITVGLFTRISCIIMIPVIVVSIIFVNIKNFDRNSFDLFLTILVFILLVIFAIKGSLRFSADEYFFRRRTAHNKIPDSD